MPLIEVESRVLGDRRDGLQTVFFDAGRERLTVRAIVLRTVEEQVRDLNARRELTRHEALRRLARQYHTEDELVALRQTGGPSPSPDRLAVPIDLVEAQTRALEAFEAGRCPVFADERQLERLDQEVDVTAGARVRFVRLLPLRGG